jgi:hypothetical protein
MNWDSDAPLCSARRGSQFSVLALFPKATACLLHTGCLSVTWSSISRSRYWYLRLCQDASRNTQARKKRRQRHASVQRPTNSRNTVFEVAALNVNSLLFRGLNE